MFQAQAVSQRFIFGMREGVDNIAEPQVAILERIVPAISQQLQSLSVQIYEHSREQINTNLELSMDIRNLRNDVSINNQFVLDEFYRVRGY